MHPNIAQRPDRFKILGFPIDLVDYRAVFQQINAWRTQGVCRFIILATAADIQLAQTDGLGAAAHRSGLNLPDGIAVVIAARLMGHRPSGRVAGPDLMLRLCDWGQEYGYRHFFYGSTNDVVERLIANLTRRFAHMEVAGFLCPPFRDLTPQEDAVAVEKINACRPDIVWVGLGGMRQICWMSDHLGRIRAAAMIGVGAAFNFHSGLVRRAPAWLRRIGLEWSYRMLTEPRKIIPRTRHTLAFCAKAIAQACMMRLSARHLQRTWP